MIRFHLPTTAGLVFSLAVASFSSGASAGWCASDAGRQATPCAAPTGATLLKWLDTNGDGAVSREEFISDHQQVTKAKERDKRSVKFDRLDANRDGMLSTDELDAVAAYHL
jgi:hypothetical protein